MIWLFVSTDVQIVSDISNTTISKASFSLGFEVRQTRDDSWSITPLCDVSAFCFDNKLQITSKSVRLQVASSTSSFAHYLLEGFYSFMKSLDAHILVDYIMAPICTHKNIPLNMPTDPNICLPKCPTDTNTCVLLDKFGRTNLHSRGRRPPGGDSELDEHNESRRISLDTKTETTQYLIRTINQRLLKKSLLLQALFSKNLSHSPASSSFQRIDLQ